MKNSSAQKNNRRRRGQSLIEALVALTILMVALLGIEALLTRSFLLDRVTADQTKATYLASEGIEIAKSLIDHDVYEDIATGGNAGGWGHCLPPGDYQLDFMTVNCPSPNNFDGTPLGFDPTMGLYSYDHGLYGGTLTPTDFVRRIHITEPSANEIDVESTVTWSTGSVIDQSLTLEDQFYNWNPGD
jgi:hypothetical protein